MLHLSEREETSDEHEDARRRKMTTTPKTNVLTDG